MLSNNLKGAKMVEEDISADNTLKERFLSPPLHTKTLHQIIITSRGQLLLQDMNFIEPFISLWALFFCNWTLFMCWMRLLRLPNLSNGLSVGGSLSILRFYQAAVTFYTCTLRSSYKECPTINDFQNITLPLRTIFKVK